MKSAIAPRNHGLSLSNRLTLGVLLVFALATLVQVYFITTKTRSDVLADMQRRLATRSGSKAAEFQRSVEDLRRDAVFLSNTPPVPGIVRTTLNRGFDPVEHNELAVWKKRLNEI